MLPATAPASMAYIAKGAGTLRDESGRGFFFGGGQYATCGQWVFVGFGGRGTMSGRGGGVGIDNDGLFLLSWE